MVIDGASRHSLPHVDVGLGPWGVAVNPVTSHVYVTNQRAETVSIVSTRRSDVVATARSGFGALAEAVDPADDARLRGQ